MPIDTSMYNTAPPPNAFQTVGNAVGLQNSMIQNQILQQEVPLIQQRLQQSQMETQVMQGRQRAGQLLTQNTKPDGTVDWLGYQSAVSKDPLTAHPLVYPEVQGMVNDQLGKVDFGVKNNNGQYQPIAVSRQQANQRMGGSQPQFTQQEQPSQGAPQQPQDQDGSVSQPVTLTKPSGEIATAPPIGYEGTQQPAQHHFQDVLGAADSAKTKNAALSNVYDLAKTAPTGQVVGAFYSYLAAHGLAPAGALTEAEQLQLIQSHAAQIATAEMPGTNEKLYANQLANISADQLPKTLLGMIPYLKGVQDSKIAQAQYYLGQDPSGSDPAKINQARLFWQQHGDPRIWELQELQKSDPGAFEARAKGLNSNEAKDLAKHSKALYDSGAMGQ